MANDAGKIVVGANGSVSVADIGSPAPTDSTTALNVAFLDFGFVSEAGVQVTPGQTIVPIMAWQSAYPVRKIVSQRSLQLDFTMREFNARSIPFAFGGGILSEQIGNKFKYLPPEPEVTDPRSLSVDWRDGTRHYRLYIPNGQVTNLAQFSLSRTAPAELPVQFEANGDGINPTWILFSDDMGLEGS